MGKVARETDKILLGGKEYAVVGTPETLPVGIFRSCRALSRRINALNGDEKALEAFYKENIDSVVELAGDIITFALGEEQIAEAQAEINKMSVMEFCVFGVDVMGKLHQPGME